MSAEVPGFSEKELQINLKPRRITIAGKREAKKKGKKSKTVYAERCPTRFCASWIACRHRNGKVNATLTNGVLEFTMPKVAKVHAIRIHEV